MSLKSSGEKVVTQVAASIEEVCADDGSAATDLTGYIVQFRNVVTQQVATFETANTNLEFTFNLNFAAFTPVAGGVARRAGDIH